MGKRHNNTFGEQVCSDETIITDRLKPDMIHPKSSKNTTQKDAFKIPNINSSPLDMSAQIDDTLPTQSQGGSYR